MITPQSMQTIKNQAADRPGAHSRTAPVAQASRPVFRLILHRFLAAASVLLVVLATLTGCAPPGPRAVLDGKRLLEHGEYEQAIEQLQMATQLLPTNALAFSYLGLAFHQAGRPAEAERAYLRALALNHDLTEVHYDLGCLWLSQNRFEQAKAELTTFTLRRPNAPEGWLKLGQTQLRSHDLAAAEKSLNDALKLDPQNPEVLTTVGLARCQRKRVTEAAQFFTAALKQKPDYGPALLNLAIVAQQDLGDPRLALQKYREYLALKPVPDNAQAVSAIARQIELTLNPPPREPATNVVALASTHTNGIKPTSPELAHAPPIQKPATNVVHPPIVPKPELAAEPIKTNPPVTNAPKAVPVTNPPAGENVEVVKLGAEPVLRPAEDLAGAPAPARSAEMQAAHQNPPSPLEPAETRPQKRGFFQRINPINLFSRDDKSSTKPTLMASTQNRPPEQTRSTASSNDPSPEPAAPKFPRYTYRLPDKPPAGDRDLSERAFSEGVLAQQARRLTEAIQAYRRAVQLDPSFYDAQYNLGLAAAQTGNLSLALVAYENALAIRPESLDARYNFGLLLKQSGYALDAAAEFEKILAKYPNDGRTHLALGNLYAQQLGDPAKARQHYLAVLTLAPQSPQAGAIRYWLTDHSK